MRTTPRRAGVAVVAALGLAGLGLAHVLEYLALVPNGHHRADVLAATGHAYLPSVLSAAGFLAAVAVAAVFVRGFRAGDGNGRAVTTTGTDWTRLLPVVQAAAFVAVEVAERLVVGASLADLGPVLVLGLPLQVLAGIAGGRVLSAAARAGTRLARALAGSGFARRRPTPGWRPLADVAPVTTLAGGPTPARGPPSLLVPV